MKNWSNNSVSKFCHDIKNPVTSALISIELLKEILKSEKKEALELVKDIESDLEYIGGIVGENSSIEEFSPDKEIKKIIKRYNGAMKIDISCPKNLIIKADKIKFRRVMSNLLDNAKNAEADFVEIEVRKDPGCLSIIIKDNGCGIPKKNLSKIFEYGFSTSGSGLGIVIVKEIVEKEFKGSVEIESKTGEDHGTKVILSFLDKPSSRAQLSSRTRSGICFV